MPRKQVPEGPERHPGHLRRARRIGGGRGCARRSAARAGRHVIGRDDVDVAHLCQRLLGGRKCSLYLLIPGTELTLPPPLAANTYLTLRELSALHDHPEIFEGDYYGIAGWGAGRSGTPLAQIWLAQALGLGREGEKQELERLSWALASLVDPRVKDASRAWRKEVEWTPFRQAGETSTAAWLEHAGATRVTLAPFTLTEDHVQALLLEELENAGSTSNQSIGEPRRASGDPTAEASAATVSPQQHNLWTAVVANYEEQVRGALSQAAGELRGALVKELEKLENEVEKSTSKSLRPRVDRIKSLLEGSGLLTVVEERDRGRLPGEEEAAQALRARLQAALGSAFERWSETPPAVQAALKPALRDLVLAPVLPDNSPQVEAPEPWLESWKAIEDRFGRIAGLGQPWRRRLLQFFRRAETLEKAAVDTLRNQCQILREALRSEQFERRLYKTLLPVARKILEEAAERRPETNTANRPPAEREESEFSSEPARLPPAVQAALREATRKALPKLQGARDRALLPFVLRGSNLAGTDLYLEESASEVGQLERLVGSARSTVFSSVVPRAHKSWWLFCLPRRLFWPGGREELVNALRVHARHSAEDQIILVDTDDQLLSVHHLSGFYPMVSILSLGHYRKSFQELSSRESLFLDKRFIGDPRFEEEWGVAEPAIVRCGNPECSGDIFREPRSHQTCPHCHRRVISRCGNTDCSEDNLQSQLAGKQQTCPTCGGFNHAWFWRCDRHGKLEVAVPWAKHYCLRCQEEHRADPSARPAGQIGRRPDLTRSKPCPRCVELARQDPTHEPFLIPAELVPFLESGVNGNDLSTFDLRARRGGLVDGCRCPKCRTLLIPVDHRQGAAIQSEPTKPETVEGAR